MSLRGKTRMHLRVSIRAFTLATAGFFVVSACGPTNTPSANLAPADKQTLSVNDGTEPNSYDPTQQTYTNEAGVGPETFRSRRKPHPPWTEVTPAPSDTYDGSADGRPLTLPRRSPRQ